MFGLRVCATFDRRSSPPPSPRIAPDWLCSMSADMNGGSLPDTAAPLWPVLTAFPASANGCMAWKRHADKENGGHHEGDHRHGGFIGSGLSVGKWKCGDWGRGSSSSSYSNSSSIKARRYKFKVWLRLFAFGYLRCAPVRGLGSSWPEFSVLGSRFVEWWSVVEAGLAESWFERRNRLASSVFFLA